jgi:anaerobic carbon-monoxide dehydrogenase iron sulfur subunit
MNKKSPLSVTDLPPAMGHIVIDRELCAGCSTCEAVCALSHEGIVAPHLARLRIVDYYLEGHRIEGYVCEQCPDPPCLHACPTGAIHIDKVTGARMIDPDECSGCKVCMAACPQSPSSPISYDAVREVCIKCDLCGGTPLCVKFCPEAALSFSKEGV